ncbi:hypothetical protein SESBI_34456 [Sesbania bispinosa]|nr:hypothetical protein SESBI_34456 [Sesbania bispinosa]
MDCISEENTENTVSVFGGSAETLEAETQPLIQNSTPSGPSAFPQLVGQVPINLADPHTVNETRDSLFDAVSNASAVHKHAEHQRPLDRAASPMRASGPLLSNGRDSFSGAVFHAPDGQGALSENHSQPHDVTHNGSESLVAPTICAPFFPPWEFFAPLDQPNVPQMQSQPLAANSIRVQGPHLTNLVDKVLLKEGGIVSNTHMGSGRPKRNTKKSFWLRDFI